MKLTCYQIHSWAPKLAPGRPEREWMSRTPHRFAYRCLPLSIANSTGWEVLCPGSFTAYWNGGDQVGDIRFEAHGDWPMAQLVGSHFGSGTITFHTGYLFRTEEGWATWARGAPNAPKDGIIALDGLIETDWLPFPFTMNWLFTRPGKVTFEKDEPFCFITPIPHLKVDEIRPEIVPLVEAPALQAEYEAWSTSRDAFNNGLKTGDPATAKAAWQRFYVQGRTAIGTDAGDTHRSKRRLATPILAQDADET